VTTVTMVDYGAGNLRSLGAALERAGGRIRVSDDAAVVRDASLVVIPGVGAAGAAMAALQERGLVGAIGEALERGARLFGVCVGLQLLFERSDEGDAACLGILPGRVRRLEGARRLPHMGWNDVEPARDHPLARALPAACYFAHSYALTEAPDDVVVGRTRVEQGSFVSVVGRDRVAAVQFHPERSAEAGREMLEAVLAWAA
jgi:glutamine amidotransferase